MKNYQITSWVHHFLEDHVQPGDICIDATMGNGNDTALLSRLAGERGWVIAFDVQQMALEHTKEKLIKEQCPENYELLLMSHEFMGEYAEKESVSCITFNLGYLPGGDHLKATKGESSIRAIEAGLDLLKKKGLMTVCIYSGGDSGFEERDAVLSYIRGLDAKKYLVIVSEYANRPNNPPIPVFIIKM
ncbi:MAG: class I SAM-dependent methyltransferase [Lachnospiraceae bacterium]|nr:class I SAM-dependent methyltransferase [Lachnospiraceae bacterium]